MEQLNPYAVILHDPELRRGLIEHAARRHPTRPTPSTSVRLRFGLAQALRGLAARVEPGALTWTPEPASGR
jgi:hypothetical protein